MITHKQELKQKSDLVLDLSQSQNFYKMLKIIKLIINFFKFKKRKKEEQN